LEQHKEGVKLKKLNLPLLGWNPLEKKFVDLLAPCHCCYHLFAGGPYERADGLAGNS